jgi:hypothetical protein
MAAGIDLGDLYSRFCILDPEGVVVEDGCITTTEQALGRKFEGVELMRVVFEVGNHSAWIDRLLRSLGHERIVANAGLAVQHPPRHYTSRAVGKNNHDIIQTRDRVPSDHLNGLTEDGMVRVLDLRRVVTMDSV